VQEANRRLEDILRTSQRETFGRRSEKLSPDQFNLALEEAELAQGVLEAAQEKAEAALQRARGDTPRKPNRNRGHLLAHLPRVERVIEPASALWSPLSRHWSERQWRRGCGEMARIGEDSEPLCRHVFETNGERTARRDPGAVPGAGDTAPRIRLSPLLVTLPLIGAILG
jgi:hypothetical protein